MDYLKETDFFKTSDMCLAAVLCCYGYSIEAIDRQSGSKAVFIVKRDENFDALLQKYFTHQLRVEPLSFFGFQKELKTRLYHV